MPSLPSLRHFLSLANVPIASEKATRFNNGLGRTRNGWGATKELLMNLDVKTIRYGFIKPFTGRELEELGAYARFFPVNHVAANLAVLMRVEHFTKSNLHTWLHMGGSVKVDGKPWLG